MNRARARRGGLRPPETEKGPNRWSPEERSALKSRADFVDRVALAPYHPGFSVRGDPENALDDGPMSVAVPAAIDAVQRRSSPYAHAPRLPPGDGLNASQILANPEVGGAQLELEIGPGRGGFILERLAAHPDICIIGLEIRSKWATLVDERVRRLGLGSRGRVFAEDIRLALPRLSAGSLARVFIHFPDPWWKKRHAKRRLAQADVIEQLSSRLVPSGELFVQTDVWDTAQAYRDVVEGRPEFESFGDEPGSPLLADNPYGARSPRERRVMADGMPVVRLRYRRRASECG
jgi:tRNA (guanine-N7-)-methyltransferase